MTPGERHKVVKIEIKGNRYFETDDISERIFLHTAGFIRLRHGRYSEGFVKRDQDAIQALYRDNGFRDCQGQDRQCRTITRQNRRRGDHDHDRRRNRSTGWAASR